MPLELPANNESHPECIAEHTSRPLLALTCADIGVKPDEIESNVMAWFKLAQDWGAIVLIDEADIYMEERQTQDLERNHLVAGFLRALEYFKGILFLTTNRVGTFDEAFISRIHVPIYYAEFRDEQRAKIWARFFEKLEEDREATMRILQSAKDYTQSQELQDLKWNGREIRNGRLIHPVPRHFVTSWVLTPVTGHQRSKSPWPWPRPRDTRTRRAASSSSRITSGPPSTCPETSKYTSNMSTRFPRIKRRP